MGRQERERERERERESERVRESERGYDDRGVGRQCRERQEEEEEEEEEEVGQREHVRSREREREREREGGDARAVRAVRRLREDTERARERIFDFLSRRGSERETGRNVLELENGREGERRTNGLRMRIPERPPRRGSRGNGTRHKHKSISTGRRHYAERAKCAQEREREGRVWSSVTMERTRARE